MNFKFVKHIAPILLLLAISFAVYSNSLKNGFVNYDDIDLVLENKKIRALNFSNIYSMFSEPTTSDYLPLKELSYALDYYIWKLNPFGFHLTNVILFMMNCLLLYLLTVKIFENEVLSLLSSILFALHPIHAEAVNWVSSRKDVLSGVFFFLSLLLYAYSTSSKTAGADSTPVLAKRIYYICAIVSFIFALFSKPSVIIFPFLLLLYEYCFLTEKNVVRIEQTIIRITPFFIVAVISAAITLSVASEKEVVKTYWGNSPYLTLLIMLGVLFDYAKLLFFPINLNVRYEYWYKIAPSLTPPEPRVVIGTLILIGSIFFLLKFWRKNKTIVFCILWFFITLIPVSNIIPIAILKADRYLYLPSFAFTLFLSLVIFKIHSTPQSGEASCLPAGRKVGGIRLNYLVIFFLIISLCYFTLTSNRNTVWKDSLTLWLDTIKKSPEDELVQNNLGSIYMEKKDYEKAMKHIKEAIKIAPYYVDAHFNLAAIYNKRGQYDQEFKELKKVLELNPNFLNAYISLGNFYEKIGSNDKAIETYKKAMEIDKKSGAPHYNIAVLFSKLGLVDVAEDEYKKAISLDPDLAMAHNNLGNIYFKKRLIKEAIKEYKLAVRHDSKLFEAYNNLGSALSEIGKDEEAINFLKIAIKLKKEKYIPHFNLGRIYMKKKMFVNATREFENVLKLKPDYSEAHTNLGLVFLNLGDREKAKLHFNAALRIDPKDETAIKFLEKLNSKKENADSP